MITSNADTRFNEKKKYIYIYYTRTTPKNFGIKYMKRVYKFLEPSQLVKNILPVLIKRRTIRDGQPRSMA